MRNRFPVSESPQGLLLSQIRWKRAEKKKKYGEGVINEGRNQNIQNRQAWGKMQFWEGHRKNQYTGAIGPEEGGELDKNRFKINEGQNQNRVH